MKKATLLFLSIVVTASLVGCSGGESDMSKQETDALKNPSKTIPPEAAAGMAKMGEMVKKQADANAAAGVDSRGIPITKSGGETAPPAGALQNNGGN